MENFQDNVNRWGAAQEPPTPGTAPVATFDDGLWNGRPLADWVDEAVNDIVEGFDPRQVIVFGSVATGDEGPDSDLDVMVVFDRLDPRRRLELAAKLRRRIAAPVAVDLVVTDVDELERRRRAPGSVQAWPATKGGSSMSDERDDPEDEARRWLRESVEELRAARHLLGDEGLPGRLACFHAHLAAEKALKALLIHAGAGFPRVHDLVALERLVPPGLRAWHAEDLDLLYPWSIGGRYPTGTGDVMNRVAASVVDAAERVVRAIEAEMGTR